MNAFTPEAGMLDKIFVNKYTEKFNIILMSQVLEHIADLDETLDYLNMLLDRKGIVVIAVPHFKSLVSILQGKNDMFIIPLNTLTFFQCKVLSLYSIGITLNF